jgi:predicted dehydrogenase
MSAPVRLSVMGAGLIGKRHIEHILARPEAVLSSIVDPAPAARELAASLKVDWYPSFQDMLSGNRPEGAIVATPKWAPIERERLSYEKADPLGLQIANFCGVIRGKAAPVVSGREGLKTLGVIDAVKRAAETGDVISV